MGDLPSLRRRFVGAVRAGLTTVLPAVSRGALAATLALLLLIPAGWAALPQGNAVTDPEALLRNALPLTPGDLQELQHRLEDTSDDVRGKRWSALAGSVRRSQSLLTSRREAILSSFPAEQRQQVEELLGEVESRMRAMAAAAEATQRDEVLASRRAALSAIGRAEALAVGDFPFAIPEEFDALPRLLGRATVRLRTSRGEMTAVVDGYNAPLTAGAFVDLVQKGFYDGLPFTRAEDFYVLQTGDPEGPEEGYVDPSSGSERRVPLEIRVPGQAAPYYNKTFEELGLYKAVPVLPFSTKGTLGWAHSDKALDDGSSQFFLFLFEPELTPAGLNLIDGRYAAFGYVVDGFDVLEDLTGDDRIEEIRVVEGAGNLRSHG